MAKKLFFHYPALFSLTVRLRRTLTCLPARQVKNAFRQRADTVANKKIVIFTSIQILCYNVYSFREIIEVQKVCHFS